MKSLCLAWLSRLLGDNDDSWKVIPNYYVQDVLNAEGNFLTLQEFQNKFKIKTNFLYYPQLIAAIPSDLKKKAATIAGLPGEKP